MRIHKSIFALLMFVAVAPGGTAQEFELSNVALADPVGQSRELTALANRVLPVYKEDNRETYLSNTFALEVVAGKYLLQDKVNYQVTGANVWKHAPSLAGMTGQTLRLYLSSTKSDLAYKLNAQKDSGDSFVPLKVDMADRSDANRESPGGGVLDKAVDTWNGIEFVTDPLPKPTELSGLFSGQLDLVITKKDFDFEIQLYELTAQGDYVQLAPYWARSSYVADRSRRHLLTPGKRERMEFQSVRLMSRQLQQGSRVVAVFAAIKEPGRQINYGTGKDVSDETIQDAGVPLEIKLYADSYLDLPVGR